MSKSFNASEAALTARTLSNKAKQSLNTNAANSIKKHNTTVNGKQFTTSVSNSPAALQATTNNQTLVTVKNKKGNHYVLVETKKNGNSTPISPESSNELPPPPTEPHPNNISPPPPNTPPPNIPKKNGNPASLANLNKARAALSKPLQENKNAITAAKIPPPPVSPDAIPAIPVPGNEIDNGQLGGRRRKHKKTSKRTKKSKGRTRRQRK